MGGQVGEPSNEARPDYLFTKCRESVLYFLQPSYLSQEKDIAMTISNQTWVLRHRPVGDIKDSDLELVDSSMDELGNSMVRVKMIYLSLDPTNRIWMSDADAYLPPVGIGDGMRGGGIGVVTESRHSGVSEGAVVNVGLAHWARYNDVPGDAVSVLPSIPGLPLTAFMGPLGATGMTAYFGLTDIGKPQAGETLVVSAAAGAVGSMVGQIGKIHGCHVVGIAGSDDKCAWLTDTAGFDAAINYKKEDVGAALDKHCPNGIDINFENVGGEIMDAVIMRLNDFSRMPLCGLISSYNDTEPTPGPYAFANLLMRRTLLKGFIILDYLDRFPEGMQAMGGWLAEGKIHYETDIVEGLEKAPASLERLFSGKNLGKLVVRVSEEP
jgi:NADPH-dependent curcumin reductase CurA